jgi:hypothetical protein
MIDTGNELLKICDNPAPKGCIRSTSAFELGMYISSKIPHHVCPCVNGRSTSKLRGSSYHGHDQHINAISGRREPVYIWIFLNETMVPHCPFGYSRNERDAYLRN